MVANNLASVVVVVQCCVEFRKNIVRKESLEFDVVNVKNLEFEVVFLFYLLH